MGTDVIKSFLVGLGFGVDDASLARFNKAIQSASIKVAALYTSIQIAAAGIFKGISSIASDFETVGYSLRLVAPAVNKMLILRQAMLDAYSKAGINLTKVVQQSILFNYSLAKTKFALEAIYKSVGAKFLPVLTKQMDIFRLKIFQNMPKIQEQLTKLVSFIFKAFEATVELGNRLWSILSRVYDFFKKLDDATGGWSTTIVAAIAIWKAFNLAFLATPLGLVLSGLLAILALYDDFKVWQEGGKSFFNWGSEASKVVIGLVAALGSLAAVIAVVGAAWTAYQNVAKIATAAQWLLNIALDANPIGLVIIGVTALIALLTALDAKWKIFGGNVSGFFSNIGEKIIGFAGGGPGVAAQSLNQPAPLLPATSSSSQKVHQETNIVVQGSADANATGHAVASQQNQVNADMTRNLKGATR